jgi:hypothetical protein
MAERSRKMDEATARRPDVSMDKEDGGSVEM